MREDEIKWVEDMPYVPLAKRGKIYHNTPNQQTREGINANGNRQHRT